MIFSFYLNEKSVYLNSILKNIYIQIHKAIQSDPFSCLACRETYTAETEKIKTLERKQNQEQNDKKKW